MKARNKRVGDIYLNPVMGDLWLLKKIYDSSEEKDIWVVELVHDDYYTPFAEVDGFIKIGNLFDLIENEYGEE